MSRVRKLRTGAALIGVSATALMMSVTPASAEAVKGKLSGNDTAGYTINMESGEQFDTVLFGFTVGDKELKTYCVDIDTDIDREGPGYVEADWNSHPKPDSSFKENSAKINWVLHNAYPTVDEVTLAKNAGGRFDGGLSVKEAVTATQAAIWHFSDKENIDLDNPTTDPKASKNDIVAVYKYLIGAKNIGIGTEPKPVLTLEPEKRTGKAGSLIGPFTVTTSASGVAIAAKSPEGVIFSDKDGKELAKNEVASQIQQQDKYEFYVKVPEGTPPGKVQFTVSGDTQYSLGRLFVSEDPARPSQTIVVATSATVRLDKAGTAEWGTTAVAADSAVRAKNAENELANTGASILTPILIGVVLVGAGAGALVFQRRRRA